MTSILRQFQIFFLKKNSFICFILISLKLVPESPIDNTSMIQVMAWRRGTSDKPLPEPIMNNFCDTI